MKTNQNLVEEFLTDFRSAYNKYFENKPFLFKESEEWSITAGFAKMYFPNSFNKYHQTTYLWIKFDESLAYTILAREKYKDAEINKIGFYDNDNDNNNDDDEFKIDYIDTDNDDEKDFYDYAFFYEGLGRKDEEIKNKVNDLKKQFIEYVETL